MGYFFWVQVHTNDPLVTTIRNNGYSATIPDVSLQELLAVVDKAEEQLAYEQ